MSVPTRFATLALGCLLVSGFGAAPAWAGQPWDIAVADNSGNMDGFCSLVILPTGHPAVSYYDYVAGSLEYAWRDSEGWHSTTVDSDGDVGEENSLAILPSGYPAISYHDIGNGDLKYAAFDGLEWHTTVVDGADGGYTGDFGTSLAILPSGEPAISYRDHWDGTLKYAWSDRDAWNTTVVDDSGNMGAQSSLAILPSGQPAISYLDYSYDRLMYAWFDGETWQTGVASTPGGVNTRLVILPTGHPAIVHDAAGGLNYVYFDGKQWRSTQVDSVSGWESWFGRPGFALQPSGRPALSYIRRIYPNAPNLVYTWNDEQGWHMQVLATATGGEAGLAFLYGQPAISYNQNERLS